MKKTIDETSARIANAMRQARNAIHIPPDEAAFLLRTTPEELFQYEHATAQMPIHILAHIFTMGYRMCQVRVLEKKYRCQRSVFCKIKHAMTELP